MVFQDNISQKKLFSALLSMNSFGTVPSRCVEHFFLACHQNAVFPVFHTTVHFKWTVQYSIIAWITRTTEHLLALISSCVCVISRMKETMSKCEFYKNLAFECAFIVKNKLFAYALDSRDFKLRQQLVKTKRLQSLHNGNRHPQTRESILWCDV